jgi:DnaK suppressor protein
MRISTMPKSTKGSSVPATRTASAKPKAPAASASRAKVKAGTAGAVNKTSSVKGASKVATKKASAPSPPKRQTTRAPLASKPLKRATPKRSEPVGVDKFLDDQRALLLQEREASQRQAESLRAEAEQLAEEMEPGDTQFDEESGEGGTLNVERERDLALSAQAWAAVDEIDRALKKVDAGSYGICEQCGQPIPKARLKAVPHATLCVACKSGGLSRR